MGDGQISVLPPNVGAMTVYDIIDQLWDEMQKASLHEDPKAWEEIEAYASLKVQETEGFPNTARTLSGLWDLGKEGKRLGG